jgi:phosphoglycerate-specific signal transduction histidine kinase
MWGIIIEKVSGALITYLVMPLLSKLLVAIEAWYVEHREDTKVKEIIKDKLEKYKNAKTPEEQEAAFRELHRARKL